MRVNDEDAVLMELHNKCQECCLVIGCDVCGPCTEHDNVEDEPKERVAYDTSKTALNMTTNPVQCAAVSSIIHGTSEMLPALPDADDHDRRRAREFYLWTVAGMQKAIIEVGLADFIEDPRNCVPSYGMGSVLDQLTPSVWLLLAWEIDALDWDQEMIGGPFEDLEEVLKWTLLSIFSEMYACAGALLHDGVLSWDREEKMLRWHSAEVLRVNMEDER